MSVLETKVKAKLVETKSLEANVTIQKILDMICNHWTGCLDNYYIMNEEPTLSSDDGGDYITVGLNDYSRVNIDHIIEDVAMLFEEELEKVIKEQHTQLRHDQITSKQPLEEGENGVL